MNDSSSWSLFGSSHNLIGTMYEEIANSEARTENTNYSRISCLLMQEGTRRAQEVVLVNLPERKSLTQVGYKCRYRTTSD